MKRLLLSLVLVASALTCALGQSYPATFSERQEDPKIVRVFPNPVVDFIHVKVEYAKAQNLKLTLHNIIGNEMRIESEIIDEHEVRIRVKDLSTGYYLLAIKDDETGLRTIHKVLKK
jgi:hypothetical protein